MLVVTGMQGMQSLCAVLITIFSSRKGRKLIQYAFQCMFVEPLVQFSWYSLFLPTCLSPGEFDGFSKAVLEREKDKRQSERERFCWWKWQWHWAYCLVKHTQPPPHAAWPSNRGQWNLLIGSRGPIVVAVTEPKQSHSAAVIHRKWADFSHSRVRPSEVLPLLYSSYGGFDTRDENLCFYIVKPKRMWHAISPGMNTNCVFIELYSSRLTWSQIHVKQRRECRA